MKPSSSKKKKEPKKASYISRNETHLFSAQAEQFFIFRETFLYFEKRKPRKNLLDFRKQNVLRFQETSYTSGSNFPSSKGKRNPL